MFSITKYLSSFKPLLSFEPNHNERLIKKAKKKFSEMIEKKATLEDIYNAFQEFPLFLSSLILCYDSLELINELKNPTSQSTKEIKLFKSNKAYLDKYINSFQITSEYYRNIEQDDKAVELDETIRIFQEIKNNPFAGMQWLIAECLFSLYLEDDELEQSPKESNINIESIKYKVNRRANIYQYYFDGYDISIEDIYRNMLIRLYYFYNTFGVNIELKEQNPDRHIETIMHHIRCKEMKIQPAKKKNIHLKALHQGTPIFDYKKKIDQKDVFDHYINNVTKLFNFSDEYINNEKNNMRNKLLFS
jgi:hypothetical protein